MKAFPTIAPHHRNTPIRFMTHEDLNLYHRPGRMSPKSRVLEKPFNIAEAHRIEWSRALARAREAFTRLTALGG